MSDQEGMAWHISSGDEILSVSFCFFGEREWEARDGGEIEGCERGRREGERERDEKRGGGGRREREGEKERERETRKLHLSA